MLFLLCDAVNVVRLLPFVFMDDVCTENKFYSMQV
jgi:hypothetical protein